MSELVQPLPPAADSQKTAEESSPPSSSMPADSPDSIPDPTASPAAAAALPAEQEFPEHSIAGVTVVGHRTILRYGKKQEYFQIEDNWFSPEFAWDMRQVILRETIGEVRVETRDIIPGEPDPSLFEVPPGYKVLPKR